ncbi:MAG: hypothetical protein IJ222_09180 [Bacteroidales bacterium]|nr:hypothetical protein [Bacteroidales bacterium]
MKKYVIALMLLAAIGCCRRGELEKRAQDQLPVSMEYHLQDYYPGMSAWRIEDVKTVYANDSIVLLQCTARFRDASGEKTVRDYRYIYKIDMDLSWAEGRAMFAEAFVNILCLSDKQIADYRKRVRKTGTSIYEHYRGAGLVVEHPFPSN